MQSAARMVIGVFAALAAGGALAGCGGGGGGSSSGGGSSPAPTATPTGPPAPAPPATPTASVRQAMAGRSVIVRAARGAQAGGARPRLASGLRGHAATTDAIEEALVFDASGNPDLTQSRVLDVTQSLGAALDTATLADDGTFRETFHFAGAAAETDAVTGTLTPAGGGASVTLTGGSDVVTTGGTPVTTTLLLAGIAQTPVDPATLRLTAGTYSGSVIATDGGGSVLATQPMSLLLDASGAVVGSLDYTDAAGAAQSLTINGAIDANGEFFGTSLVGSQTFSEQFSIAPAATGAPGAVTVAGAVLDQTGAVLAVYGGALTLDPSASVSARLRPRK